MGAFCSLGIPRGFLHVAIMASQSFTVTAVLPIPEFKYSFFIDKDRAHRGLGLAGTVFARKAWCFGKTREDAVKPPRSGGACLDTVSRF
jgi:hypothetical protein